MVTHKYSLFELLEGDVMDVGLLKEKMGVLDPTSNPDSTYGHL